MRRFSYFLLSLVIIAGLYSGYALTRSLPMLQPVNALGAFVNPTPVNLPWPAYGQSAVGAVGYGILASSEDQKPLPTASVAKVMTAIAVLQKHPLKQGEQGPTLTITQQDADYYHTYVAENGSVVPVNVGERISEYQALEAMLLPSANNMAKTLAVWAYGSETAYTNYANNYAKQIGMNSSHFADASGFSPATVSTAADLVRLGTTALANPVLAEIVAQPNASIPVAGTINNVNTLLGQNGINGIKTGNTDQAGGVFLVSAGYTVGTHKLTAVTAIMGASKLKQAMNDSLPLLATTQSNFTEQTLVKAGDVVGYYNTPWHTSVNIVATMDAKTLGWKANAPKTDFKLLPLSVPSQAGQTVGQFIINPGTTGATVVPVVTSQPVSAPTWQWRLLHP